MARRRARFARWYGLGLLLMAVGLLAVLMQTVHSSVVGWIGVSTQWLSGAYLLTGSVAAARESGAAEISLAVAHATRGCATASRSCSSPQRRGAHAFFPGDRHGGSVHPVFSGGDADCAICGPGPAVLGAVLSILITNVLWSNRSCARPGNPERLQAAALFFGDCVVLILVAQAMQRAQSRAIAAEAESRFAQHAELACAMPTDARMRSWRRFLTKCATRSHR